MDCRIPGGMRWAMCAVGGALAVCGAFRADVSAEAVPFTVAVLRRDAVIVPFARFDGRRWKQAWRTPATAGVEVPVNLDSVPKRWWAGGEAAPAWQAWTVDGSARTVTVRQPDIVPVFCDRNVGLRTDYLPSGDSPPIGESPYPKDGLAVAPPRPVEPITNLGADATELAALVPVVTDAMNEIERTLKNHPVGRKARESITPRIEAAYAYGTRPRIYYLEAFREYPRQNDGHDCRAAAVGHIWIRVDDTATAISKVVWVEPCDRASERYMYPLGVIRANDRLFWLAQYAGWDDEEYYVYEIKPRTIEVRFAASGGGC